MTKHPSILHKPRMTTFQTEFLLVPLQGPGLNCPIQSQEQPSLGHCSSKCCEDPREQGDWREEGGG